jgi:hypothetical protein
MRNEGAIKSGVPAKFYEDEMVIPIMTNKIEETHDFAAISFRNRIHNCKFSV